MESSGIQYKKNMPVELDQFIYLYKESTLADRRPAENQDAMRQMMENANLIITAWDGDSLVGISRTLTDFVYVAYLADLAVAQTHQRMGIGKRLVEETQLALGSNCKIVLLSAPAAIAYYPRIGFDLHPSAWVLPPGKRVR